MKNQKNTTEEKKETYYNSKDDGENINEKEMSDEDKESVENYDETNDDIIHQDVNRN